MKNIFLYAFLLFFAAYTAQSQFISGTFASQGLITARDKAVEDGFDEPLLIFVASLNQDVEFMGATLQMRFDAMTGKGDVWMYMFTNAERTDFIAYSLFKPLLGGYYIDEIPAEEILESGLPIDLESTLDDYDWEDSDKAAGALSSSEDFSEFYALEPDVFMIALFVNGGMPGLTFGEPYWGAMMNKGDMQQMCAAHAINLDVICLIEASVDMSSSTSISVYPNPTNDYLFIQTDDNANLSSIQVFNVLGSKMDAHAIEYGDKYKIDMSNLIKGTYFVKLGNRFVPFIKN